MVFRTIVLRTISMTSKEATTEAVKNCIFCNIVTQNDPHKIIYQDETVVVFPDIHPCSDHHFLVIPRLHLPNASQLNSSHKNIVEQLIKVAKELLQEKCSDQTEMRLGLHWPPFNSVSHLHLHAIAPVANMSFLSRLIFRPNSFWFVSPEYVLSRL